MYSAMDVFVNKCKSEYEDYIKFGSIVQMCHTYKHVNEDGQIVFNSVPFLSTKSFDNMLFEGKDELVRRIKMFESPEGREKSDKIGKQHAFGMLLHGEPGCGKTSCIKAVARLTGRHIVVIQMDQILKDSTKGCNS
jgi:SpoVK/Ycf46/Vps4 family AAA+-type ATPase